jgi:hypothetical protein
MAGVELCQSCQSFVKRDEIGVVVIADLRSIVKRDPHSIAAAFLAVASAGGIDQNPPHKLRRDGKKMGAALPIDLIGVDQPKKCLINKCAGLERDTRPLSTHEISGNPPELAIHGRNEPIECGLVTVPPLNQELSDLRILMAQFRHIKTQKL